MTIVVVSILLSILIVTFGYLLITPNVSSETFLLNSESTLDPKLQKALMFLGGDISSLVPNGVKQKKRRNRTLQRLLITSGNPWNVNANEFFIIQIFLGLAGLVLGGIASVVLINSISPLAVGFITIGIAILGYMYPTIVYKQESTDRIKAFKHDLPESIDFLIIAMSGGTYGLASAISRVIKYQSDGVMKKEFERIIDSINSGRSLSSALDDFAERAPTEGIEAFVNSLNNANKLSAPVHEILRNRAESSRADLNAEIDKKIATLSTKVLLAFGPMAYISLLIVVLSPVATSLLQLLG